MSKLKNILIVTGGAGFIGSNLIELLLEKTNFEIKLELFFLIDIGEIIPTET